MASQQVFSDLDISGKAKSSAQGIFMGAVSSLPSASALSGGVVFNTTDNKHYYSNGSAWSVLDIVAGKDSDGVAFSTKYATKTALDDAVAGFVSAEDPVSITDTIPPTFDGHTIDDFVLESEASRFALATDVTTLQSSKLDKTGGTMTGKLVAQSNTDYATAQVRNVIISTSSPSGGSSGDIWIRYQA